MHAEDVGDNEEAIVETIQKLKVSHVHHVYFSQCCTKLLESEIFVLLSQSRKSYRNASYQYKEEEVLLGYILLMTYSVC